MVENWLRWHVGTCLDPKWKVVARRSAQPIHLVLAVWAMMLECAAQASTRGTLEGWDDEDVAAAIDLDNPTKIARIRDAMQGKVLDGDRLIRWEKRQPKREDSSASRTRDYRARKEASQAGGDDPQRDVTQRDASRRSVTPGDPRGEEKREEEKKDKKEAVFPLRENTGAPRVSADAEPAVAPPVEPKPEEAPAPKPRPAGATPISDVMWAEGLAYLTGAGVPEREARPVLGRWRKLYGEGEVLVAIAEAQRAAASAPVEFITAILQRRKTTRSRDAPQSRGYAI